MAHNLISKIKKFKNQASVLALAGLLAMPMNVYGQIDPGERPDGTADDIFDVFQTVANIMLALIGAVAVVMLIIGGFRYVASGGDSSAIEGAKNTILYAIIGIVVAFLAYAAINFLTDQLGEAAFLLETVVV